MSTGGDTDGGDLDLTEAARIAHGSRQLGATNTT